MAASHYELDNLTVFVDNNKLQTDGFTADIMSPNPVAEKWKAFAFVGETVKGKGVASLEERVDSHSLSKPLTEAETERLLGEVEGR